MSWDEINVTLWKYEIDDLTSVSYSKYVKCVSCWQQHQIYKLIKREAKTFSKSVDERQNATYFAKLHIFPSGKFTGRCSKAP